MDYQIVNIRSIATEVQGALSFFEGSRDVPFSVKRIYYIYNAPAGTQRGGHAHRNLHQILFCPYGKIEIVLDDDIIDAVFEEYNKLLDEAIAEEND